MSVMAMHLTKYDMDRSVAHITLFLDNDEDGSNEYMPDVLRLVKDLDIGLKRVVVVAVTPGDEDPPRTFRQGKDWEFKFTKREQLRLRWKRGRYFGMLGRGYRHRKNVVRSALGCFS